MVAQVSYQYLTDASEIYAESFAIIRREADLTRFPDLVKQCFSSGKWQKLLAVRKQYDPDQRFVSYLDRYDKE